MNKVIKIATRNGTLEFKPGDNIYRTDYYNGASKTIKDAEKQVKQDLRSAHGGAEIGIWECDCSDFGQPISEGKLISLWSRVGNNPRQITDPAKLDAYVSHSRLIAHEKLSLRGRNNE